MSVRLSSLHPRRSMIPRTIWRARATLSGSAGIASSTSGRSRVIPRGSVATSAPPCAVCPIRGMLRRFPSPNPPKPDRSPAAGLVVGGWIGIARVLAQRLERPPDEARDVHLGDADALSDLRLGQ